MNGKRLGIMLGARPGTRNFEHALGLGGEAVRSGVEVYLYCIDDAVAGLTDTRFKQFKESGAKIFACAYSLQKRNLSLDCDATLVGLTLLNDLIVSTDRFVSFT